MNSNIGFFGLVDGQSAIVRILSTKVDKIPRAFVHKIEVNGTSKNVKCLGKDNCPLCDEKDPFERLYMHLWDYTDNREKVWQRTTNEKFMSLLYDIEENWGNLSECVIKITREGTNFPNYTVTVQNPSKYPFPSELGKDVIDQDIAYRFYLYRSKEELEEFVKTGYLPEHVKKNSTYIPKSEYIKQQNEKKEKENLTSAMNSYVEHHNQNNVNNDEDDFDDPFIHKRK